MFKLKYDIFSIPTKQEENSNTNESSKNDLSKWREFKSTPKEDPDLQNQVKILKVRSALNKQQFYKKDSDIKTDGPMQLGTVHSCSVDFYNRPKKKASWLSSLMKDNDLRQKIKQRMTKIQVERGGVGKKGYKQKITKKKKH